MNKLLSSFSSNSLLKAPWKGLWLLALAIGCLGIFFGLPSSYYRMVAWPWVFVWQLGLLSAMVLAVWMLRQTQVPFQTLGHGLDWVLALFAVPIIFSFWFALVPQLALWYAAMAGGYVCLLYVLYNWVIQNKDYLEHLWFGILALGLVTNTVSLAIWQPSLSMWLSDDFYEAVRNSQPLGQHNFVGGFEVLMLPLAITYTLAHNGWRRWLGTFASLLSFIGLYASGSRGAMLGLVAMAFATVALLVYVAWRKKRFRLMAYGAVAFLIVLISPLSNPRVRYVLTFVVNAEGANPLAALLKDGPILDRWRMMQAAGNMLQDHSLIGVGIGNMARQHSLYRPILEGNTNVRT
jgi:hypothetical protein